MPATEIVAVDPVDVFSIFNGDRPNGLAGVTRPGKIGVHGWPTAGAALHGGKGLVPADMNERLSTISGVITGLPGVLENITKLLSMKDSLIGVVVA